MSESDDSDILADIRALDEVLSAKKNTQQCFSTSSSSSSQRLEVLSDVNSENNDDKNENNDDDNYLDYIYTNSHIDASLNAYEINTKLLTGLTIVKNQLTVLLEKYEQKIKVLDEKMTLSKDIYNFTSKLTISHAGMPYFKDKDFFSAPKNYDAKLKEARGELFLPFLKKPSRWSRKDRETLYNAINNQAIEFVCEDFNKGVEESKNQVKGAKLALPKNFKEMIEAMGDRDFDWHKISAMNFDNKHSPGECQAMWNVYLHPKFKKDEWTSIEDKKLLRYVNEYKNQNWNAITLILGTNRSAYQCFIRYNTIKKITYGHNWTKQEDRHLFKVIDTIRIGDYIPWTDIANHMRHRTKQQVYIRWTYRKAPHLRKGRFTDVETSNLLKAVQKYGKDFSKIAHFVMPHRTSVQLHLHYTTITAAKNSNIWSMDDDVTLIDLQFKYKNNWSKIATYFSNKSRTQVRHRYSALLRYVEKGVSLDNIPRPPPTVRNRRFLKFKKSKLQKSDKNSLLKLQTESFVNIPNIQLRLYETLCFPPSNKSNNSEKKFYDAKQLMLNTKKLYNALNLLNAQLDIPDESLEYIQLNNQDKLLLSSLKNYISMLKSTMQNKKLVEEYRMRMFGYTPNVSKSDFFIPPLPFDGHVKSKKTKYQYKTSINYDLNVNEKFLVNMPLDFSATSYIYPLITDEEQIQFSKFSQFLINDYHNYHQNIHLYKTIKCVLSSSTESENRKSNSAKQASEQMDQANSTDEEDEGNKIKRINLSNVILPNQATLLGWKNLLLWKLLYDYQDECYLSCKSMASSKTDKNQTITNSSPVQTESADYRLLRTRLLQLFKIPIGLSNTILQTDGPETIFSVKPTSEKTTVPKKRKVNDTKKTQVNSKLQLDSDTTSSNSPVLRKRKRST